MVFEGAFKCKVKLILFVPKNSSVFTVYTGWSHKKLPPLISLDHHGTTVLLLENISATEIIKPKNSKHSAS